MKSPFAQEMYRFIVEQNMIQAGETVLVAVSGGADSLALLYGLYTLQKPLNCHLHVVHLNHSLRYNSSVDAEFVYNHTESLGLPYTGNTVDIGSLASEWKLSIETAGRKARYEFFDSVCDEVGANKVALGHHQDDIAETVLMNLIRGGGADGLKGIAPIRDRKYIRPLSIFSRKEIESYLKSINLIPIDDPTNTDRHYLRNRIRHEILPLLEDEYNPNIKVGLSRTAAVIGSESDYLDALTKDAFKLCTLSESQPCYVALNRDIFLQNHIALQRRIIRQAVSEIIGVVRDFSFDHSKSIHDVIIGDKPNAIITLPRGIQFRRAYQKLFFEKTKTKTNDYVYTINVPGKTPITILNTEITSELFTISDIDPPVIPNGKYEVMLDHSKIKLPLQVRNRREGDRIQPHGMQGTKKIKDYFIDLKVPHNERDRIPLLVCGDEILWLIGFTTNEKFRIQRKSQRCIHLKYGRIETGS